eukprot:gene13390-13517_t
MAAGVVHALNPSSIGKVGSRSQVMQRPAMLLRKPMQGLASRPAPRMFTSTIQQNNLIFPQQQQHRGVVCHGLFGLGLPEIAVIAGVAALIFGPSKLPELGKGLGQTVKSFQTAAKEFKSELEAAAAPDDEDPAAAAAPKEAEKPVAKKD